MMDIELQKAAKADGIQFASYRIGFCGEVLDDRGKAAVEEISGNAGKMVTLRYDPRTFEVDIGGDRVSADAFPDALRPLLTGQVVLEATTLGFVEILLCCRALDALGVSEFDILYVEPKHYHSPRRREILHRRDFELSGNVPGYRAIPGYAILLGDQPSQKGVFFLGYEESRLRRAFEDLQMIHAATSAVTFGVPAFKPGWEMDAIANNISVIREQNIRGGLYFCGAENPAAVIEILSSIHQGLSQGQRLFVAPIGTKPHGIGVALFVSEHRNVGIIYDHPRRTQGRSDAIAHWHLFSVRDYGSGN